MAAMFVSHYNLFVLIVYNHTMFLHTCIFFRNESPSIFLIVHKYTRSVVRQLYRAVVIVMYKLYLNRMVAMTTIYTCSHVCLQVHVQKVKENGCYDYCLRAHVQKVTLFFCTTNIQMSYIYNMSSCSKCVDVRTIQIYVYSPSATHGLRYFSTQNGIKILKQRNPLMKGESVFFFL